MSSTLSENQPRDLSVYSHLDIVMIGAYILSLHSPLEERSTHEAKNRRAVGLKSNEEGLGEEDQQWVEENYSVYFEALRSRQG